MIKMLNNNEVNLSDLINIDYLQKLQDNLSAVLGINVLTIDKNNSITKPSNTKDSKTTNFTLPIIVNNKHIASILGGQIPTEYKQDLKKIEISSQENPELLKSFLSFVSNSISEIANKNYELIMKNQKEKLTEAIVKKIRSTLDAEEIKKYFVEITQQYFNADRCVFADFDNLTNKFLPFQHEKLKSENIQSLINVDIEVETSEFCARLKKGKDIIIRDLDKTVLKKNILEYGAIKTIKHSDVKSDYGLLVKFHNRILGVLIIHFIKEKKVLNNDELNFLKIIREHTGTGIGQAELYEKTKEYAKREKLLRKITETIRNSLDCSKTKQAIVEIVGKTLSVDRCFISEYDKISDKFLIVNEEYLSSDNLVSFKGVNVNEHILNFIQEFKRGSCLVMDETGIQLGNEKIDLNDSKFNIEKETSEKFNIKSGLVFPLFYREEFLGNLVLHSSEIKHKMGDDEIDFLNLISDQIALALHQAKMYKKIQLQAEREKISRNIIEIMRSTLDKSIIKKLFVNNIGKFFNADRVFICDYDSNTKTFLPVDEYSEFLCDKELKSFVGVEEINEAFKQDAHILAEKKEILIPSFEEYKKNNALNQDQLNIYEIRGIKSTFSFPITYQDKLVGILSINFTNDEVWLSNEEISRIRNICTQAGIALYHAGLYQEAQEALQTKGRIVSKIKNGVEPTVNVIVHDLDNVLKSCHELMELTKDISREGNS